MRLPVVLHLLDILRNIVPVAVEVSVNRSLSIGVANVNRFPVTIGLDLDPGDIPVINGEYRMSGCTLGFDIDARMKMVAPISPKFPERYMGIFRGG